MKKNFFILSFLFSIVCFGYVSAQTWEEKNIIETGPQTTTVTLTIEVPSEYLETKSILETATIYGIDAKVLAQKIGEHYFNKFQVQELDDISTLQQTHGVNIDAVKEIAKQLQNFYPAPPEQKDTLIEVIKEKKILSQREFVFWTVVAILCLYFLSYFLTYRELIHHNIHKRAWNTLLLISFVWYAVIILSYIIPKIYSINIQLWLDVIYHNLWIWFIIVFLWFSHALRYLFHYRPLKKKAHHNISHHVSSHHKDTHKPTHKTSHPHHTATKLNKVK